MTNTSTQTETAKSGKWRDLHQQVTDTIIGQLEAGTVPWHQPWKGENRILSLPKNSTTGKKYQGINILLLWSAAIANDFPTQEWATFKQWSANKESIRKGEKGSLVVYYDVLEKEVEGEVQEIPFLKSSVVFNRSQLARYQPDEAQQASDPVSTIENIFHVDEFVSNTKAIVEQKGDRACYIPSLDKIWMPKREAFTGTATCTATEGYYSTLLHELTHWSGHESRLNRVKGKTFGDENYAMEELTAELGAAFLCAQFEIGILPKGDHASYIDHWLKIMKENKKCIFKASTEANKAVNFLNELQP
jgi:antirestriction protein ArdC